MKFQTNLNIHYRYVGVYALAFSEVIYLPLEVVVGALKKAHIHCSHLCLKEEKKKNGACAVS